MENLTSAGKVLERLDTTAELLTTLKGEFDKAFKEAETALTEARIAFIAREAKLSDLHNELNKASKETQYEYHDLRDDLFGILLCEYACESQEMAQKTRENMIKYLNKKYLDNDENFQRSVNRLKKDLK